MQYRVMCSRRTGSPLSSSIYYIYYQLCAACRCRRTCTATRRSRPTRRGSTTPTSTTPTSCELTQSPQPSPSASLCRPQPAAVDLCRSLSASVGCFFCGPSVRGGCLCAWEGWAIMGCWWLPAQRRPCVRAGYTFALSTAAQPRPTSAWQPAPCSAHPRVRPRRATPGPQRQRARRAARVAGVRALRLDPARQRSRLRPRLRHRPLRRRTRAAGGGQARRAGNREGRRVAEMQDCRALERERDQAFACVKEKGRVRESSAVGDSSARAAACLWRLGSGAPHVPSFTQRSC